MKSLDLRRLRTPLAWLGSIALLIVIGAYLIGAFDERVAPDAPVSRRPAPTGEVLEVELVRSPLIERSPGTLRPVRETLITSRIVAEVREVLVGAGDRVTAGDPVALLDDRDLQAMVRQAEDELVGAEARLHEAEVSYERISKAAESSSVAKSTLDQAEAAKLSAESEVSGLRQRVERAHVDLSHATIRAPFDGVVVDRYAYPGDLASPERPLLRLYDPERLRLESHVRESLAIHLRVSQEVAVELEALEMVVQGTIEEVVPTADAAARSFLVKVEVPLVEGLYPGMYGRLLLNSGTAERLLIPERAVTHVGQLSYVTLADDHATRRLVILGEQRDDGTVEILSGVEPGLRVRVLR